MTINLSDNDPRVSYDVAAGVTQTSFTVSFEFFDNDDLNVYVDGTLKTLTTDYTVSGGDGSTGTVTMSVTGAAGGSKVVITRDIDLDRTTDFPSSGPFNIASLNTELDRCVAIGADLKDQADRALQLTDFDAAASLTLPEVDDRKGKTLAFNASTGAVEAGPSISDVQTVSAAAADIATLADIEDGTDATDAIQTVAGISSNVSTVAGISANVTTVAGISANVTAVAGDEADIGTVAGSIANVNTVAGISSDVTTVAGISANVTTVAGDSADIQAVAADAADIGTVASNIADVNTAATNITDIQNASTNAATATTKASEAATSATNAATSATNAATSATAAAASQTAAAASAASAASAFDNFDDTYLGSKTSDPTTDNDGDPLTNGDLYFNSTANEMRVYDGANWIAATSAGSASLINYNYTATASQTTFSGADDNAATMSYTQQNLIVTLNGIVLEDGTDYTASNGTSIVLATGAAAGDELNVVAFKSFTTADMVPASTGGTFSGNVTFDGTFTSRGIDDNATSTAMTLDASGNLLVGKSANDNTNGVVLKADGEGYFVKDNGSPLSVNRLSTDGVLQYFFKDTSLVGSIGYRGGGIMYNATSNYGLKYYDINNINIVHPATTTGLDKDDSVSLGYSGSRFKDLYLSGGVYLGGTGSANKLDDYEEGTWTPNGNWSTANAKYVKVGSLVHISMDLTADSTGGTSQITNLPFSCNYTVGTGIYTSGVNWANGYTSPTIAVAGSIIYFRVVADGLAFTAVGITANANVHASFTYETTS